jgi:tetratricopeptide (TPR) repeat protein
MRMKGWWLMFLCLLVFIACGPSASSYVKQAEGAFSRGDYEASVEYLTKAIEKDEDNADYFSNRARCYIKLKNYDKASADFELAIKYDPYNWNTYDVAGLHYKAIGDYNKAIDKFTDGLKIDTLSIKSKIYLLGNRSRARNRLKDFEGGLKDAMTAYKLDTTYAGGMAVIASTYENWGKYDEAEKWYKKAITVGTKNISIYNSFGYLYVDMKRYEDAIGVFNKAVELNKKGAFDEDNMLLGYVYNNKGYAQLQTDSLDEAVDNINHSIELYANNSFAYKNMALCYIKKGDFKEACFYLQKAERLGFKEEYGPEVDELIDKYCQ